jgi:hypothetical protein
VETAYPTVFSFIICRRHSPVSFFELNFKHSQENVKGSLKKSKRILLVIALNTYTHLGAATFPSEVFDRNFRQVYFVCIASTCLKLNYPIYRLRYT